MKKALIAVIAAAILNGCTYNACTDCKPRYYDNGSQPAVQTSFNDEVYVWENFFISTNRVTRP